MKQETCTPKKQCLGLRTLTIFWVANSNIAKKARGGTSLEQSHSSTRQRARREPGHGRVWTSADPTGVVTAVSTQRAPGACCTAVLRAGLCLLMGWSGRAPAPPASEAGKG